jgi:hypothetical protein
VQAIDQVALGVGAAYPTAILKKQSRSVNVKLPAYPFAFDLVPAWLRTPDGFWIPDTDINGWLPTDPDAHATLLTGANDASKLKLKPLIKMVKHWNRNNLERLRSFHIELICVDLMRLGNLQESQSLQFGVATILVQLHKYAGATMMDPVYGMSRVDKELSAAELTELRSRINYDASNVVDAIRLEAAGDHKAAIEKWKHVFVVGFPK